MPSRTTLPSPALPRGFLPPYAPRALAQPAIIDNDNGNPDFTVSCTGDRELPVLLCECMYGMGFQVVSCHARMQDGRTHVRLTVAESDGSPLDARRAGQARALVEALTDPLAQAAE